MPVVQDRYSVFLEGTLHDLRSPAGQIDGGSFFFFNLA